MKLKNKKYKQNHMASIAQIKRNSKKSFELNIHDTDQYDDYIGTWFMIQKIYIKG